jgi:hypothetical protein
MDEIKKFLRMMEKEALVDLCASMMFKNLIDMVDLHKALSTYEKAGGKDG